MSGNCVQKLHNIVSAYMYSIYIMLHDQHNYTVCHMDITLPVTSLDCNVETCTFTKAALKIHLL